jgi:hypothetical protein
MKSRIQNLWECLWSNSIQNFTYLAPILCYQTESYIQISITHHVFVLNLQSCHQNRPMKLKWLDSFCESLQYQIVWKSILRIVTYGQTSARSLCNKWFAGLQKCLTIALIDASSIASITSPSQVRTAAMLVLMVIRNWKHKNVVEICQFIQ